MGADNSKQQQQQQRKTTGYPHHTVEENMHQYQVQPGNSFSPAPRSYGGSQEISRQNSNPQRMSNESMANYNARLSSGDRSINLATVNQNPVNPALYPNLSSSGFGAQEIPSLQASVAPPSYDAPPTYEDHSGYSVLKPFKDPLGYEAPPIINDENFSSTNENPLDDLEFWIQQPMASKPANESIDLKVEIPDFHDNVKNVKNDSKYLQFNKQVNKNKSPSDIRSCLVGNKYLSDVTFYVQETEIPAHKTPLITSSYLFYDFFHLKGENEMKIDSIGKDTFIEILTYCYTNKIQVTKENVQELLKAANKLQIKQIVNICHGFINGEMNPTTIFEIFEKVLEENNEIFQKKCIDFIIKNETACFASPGFYTMKILGLTKILEVCKFPREKSEGIIEKWHNGPVASEVAAVPAAQKAAEPAKKKPAKKPQSNPGQPQPIKQSMPNLSAPGILGPAPPKKAQKNQQKKPGKQSVPNLMTPPFQGYGQMFPPQHLMGPPQRQMGPPHRQMGPPQRQMGPPPNFLGTPRFQMAAPPPPPLMKQPARPPKAEKLITIDDEDDDDRSSIISHDDEAKVKVAVIGKRHQGPTEFSRIDLVCKRSMVINEIWFSCNLAENSKEFRLTVTVIDQDNKNEIHNRLIKITKSDQKMNFLRLNRNPLKLYVGQKFFIKINFSEKAERFNINANNLSSNHLVDLNRADDSKKYFNCISSLIVSEMSLS